MSEFGYEDNAQEVRSPVEFLGYSEFERAANEATFTKNGELTEADVPKDSSAQASAPSSALLAAAKAAGVSVAKEYQETNSKPLEPETDPKAPMILTGTVPEMPETTPTPEEEKMMHPASGSPTTPLTSSERETSELTPEETGGDDATAPTPTQKPFSPTRPS